MTRLLRTAHLALGLALALTCGAAQALDADAAYARSQAAIGTRLGAHQLTNRDGRLVSLDDLRGKPLVVNLIYTSCYHVCPTITRQLARAVTSATTALGRERFTIATLGFDSANDTPERMRVYAREQGIRDDEWLFLAADAATVAALAAELGFTFEPSPHGFEHLSQVSIVDADGRIYRQVYGDEFIAPFLVEPLTELISGRPGHRSVVAQIIDKVRLICTIYDPRSGHYRFDYSLAVSVLAGVLCLGGTALFIVRAWRRSSTTGHA